MTILNKLYSSVTKHKINTILVPLRLKGSDTYFVWKLLFDHALSRYNLTGIVDGSEPCPPPFSKDQSANPAFEIWKDKDQTVITWIKSTLSDHVLPLVAGATSSRELWLSLEKRFRVAGVSFEYRKTLAAAAAALPTADICDAHGDLLATGDLRVLPPIFTRYGKWRAFSGPIVTVKVFEDSSLIVQLVATKGEGRVLVVDGEGSMRRAVCGGMIVKCAEVMGWAGVVINGCIRDMDDINELEIGVTALATCPVRPTKNGDGQKHVPIKIGGILISEGEWLYADGDGILVSKSELSL